MRTSFRKIVPVNDQRQNRSHHNKSFPDWVSTIKSVAITKYRVSRPFYRPYLGFWFHRALLHVGHYKR